MDMYTLLYLKWITNKDLLYSTGNTAQCWVAAWMGGAFGGEWIHVYVWLSPFTVHLKLPLYQLLIGYTPIQNKKLDQKKKRKKIFLHDSDYQQAKIKSIYENFSRCRKKMDKTEHLFKNFQKTRKVQKCSQPLKRHVCYAMLCYAMLSHFSRVRLCATPQTAAHQAPPSLGFSRPEHWSGLPFPSPMHESEK